MQHAQLRFAGIAKWHAVISWMQWLILAVSLSIIIILLYYKISDTSKVFLELSAPKTFHYP